jgi:hypothetical protein
MLLKFTSKLMLIVLPKPLPKETGQNYASN